MVLYSREICLKPTKRYHIHNRVVCGIEITSSCIGRFTDWGILHMHFVMYCIERNVYIFKKKNQIEDIEMDTLSIWIIFYFMIAASLYVTNYFTFPSRKRPAYIIYALSLIQKIVSVWWNLKRQNWHTLWIFYAVFSSISN